MLAMKYKDDKVLIKRYVYISWWAQIKALPGVYKGKKSDRDKEIKKLAKEMYEDFTKLIEELQEEAREIMLNEIKRFEDEPLRVLDGYRK